MVRLSKSPPEVGKMFMHGPRAAKVMPGHGPRSDICCLKTVVILDVAQLSRLPHICVILDTSDMCSTGLHRTSEGFNRVISSPNMSPFLFQETKMVLVSMTSSPTVFQAMLLQIY